MNTRLPAMREVALLFLPVLLNLKPSSSFLLTRRRRCSSYRCRIEVSQQMFPGLLSFTSVCKLCFPVLLQDWPMAVMDRQVITIGVFLASSLVHVGRQWRTAERNVDDGIFSVLRACAIVYLTLLALHAGYVLLRWSLCCHSVALPHPMHWNLRRWLSAFISHS